ncbi:MAG TPA: 1-acyl-sn-glycerol-3-phosphate acyltransferase, partial [Roseimicrobium sp.]|nr:1-acyl-sn-glycerol-3-phosphate acyltransferase [Roseimicrobium sp.]
MTEPTVHSRTYTHGLIAYPVIWIARLLYRIRTRGAERIPAGGAMLVANHLSYMDAIVLQVACPRPIRFVGSEAFMKLNGFNRLAFKLTGTIPVSPNNALDTMRRVSKS